MTKKLESGSPIGNTSQPYKDIPHCQPRTNSLGNLSDSPTQPRPKTLPFQPPGAKKPSDDLGPSPNAMCLTTLGQKKCPTTTYGAIHSAKSITLNSYCTNFGQNILNKSNFKRIKNPKPTPTGKPKAEIFIKSTNRKSVDIQS
jgi:hypothetical protein